MDEKNKIQKELFEEFVEADKKKHLKAKFWPGPKRTIALSYEHLIFIAMAFIITAAVFFSLGAERGKRLQVKSLALVEKESRQTPVQIAEILEPVQKKAATKEEEAGLQPKEAGGKKEVVSVYTVQVACYVKKDSADQEAQRLKEKGFKPFVFSSGNYYIVCGGEFKSKTEAASEQKKLRKIYPDCYVRRKQGG